MYAVDLNIPGASGELKINLAQETLHALLAHWLAKRRKKSGSQLSSNGDIISSGKDVSVRNHSHPRGEVDDAADSNSLVLPSFEFSTSTPSIITEGSQGGARRANYIS